MDKGSEVILQLKDRRIFVKTIGEGEAIIFLHGGPGSSHQFFLPHVLPLSQHYKLVLYDQNGCGRSGSLRDNAYSMQDEVATLEMLRQELQLEKLNLFGESWGSILALLYAAAHPKNVNKLLLTAAIGVDSKGYIEFQKQLLSRMKLVDKIKLFLVDEKIKKGKASMEAMLKILDPYYVYSKDALQNKVQTPVNKVVNDRIGTDINNHYDLTPALQRLSSIPILTVQGDHDILTPAKIKELLTDLVPDARLMKIENCGHWTVIEKPIEMNKIAYDFFGDGPV
ncbi:alpha/beta hydrolase [Bacillus salacetis]|uniref:Alpha/beta hydrolase n=1 Tax=Bacillus salacetis TaxID=2315464 RepID=A0A3A1QRQ4_9BACI|nr:alpha/beta hydrolase [Bacillus salacetis]RIW28941.1 alpha/beta hydrolase [Bacillus salacetis]